MSPTGSLVAGGVPDVGGMNGFSASDLAATDDHRWYIGVYFQDDWKVNPELTLNLGLRWDYFTPYAETRGFQANFIPQGGNGTPGTYYVPSETCSTLPTPGAFQTVAALSGISIDCESGRTLGNAQKDNFAPRVGFAYRLRPTLVVRGGFGTAYGALGNLGYGGTLGTNYPFVYTQGIPAPDTNHPLLVGSSPGAPATMEYAFTQFNFQNPAVLASPTPYSTTPVACPSCPNSQYIGSNFLGLSLYGREYSFQTPLVSTENFTIEDQFTNHDAVQIGYVGTQGRHLDNLGYNNADTEILPPSANAQLYIPYPYFNRNSTYETTDADSSFNSLQVTYQHRMSFGLSLLGNYTWSKCLSDQHTQASQYSYGGYRAEWLPNFGIRGDYALCDSDAADLIHVSGTYDLAVRPWTHLRGTCQHGDGPGPGRMDSQRFLHFSRRTAAHGHLPQCHHRRLRLRGRFDGPGPVYRPEQLPSMAEPRRFREPGGRGHDSGKPATRLSAEVRSRCVDHTSPTWIRPS